MLRRGYDYEEGRHVALRNFCKEKSLVYKNFDLILLDYYINSRVCNYGKRVVIGLLRTVIKCLIFIF